MTGHEIGTREEWQAALLERAPNGRGEPRLWFCRHAEYPNREANR